uniref:Uncharacterized protein n=1 Tax=Amphiprion percula TaxID=161767 RepID=A0A3P8SBT5_AMPPE
KLKILISFCCLSLSVVIIKPNSFHAIYLCVGAPRTAVYKFVRCNPEGSQANCVTQQTPEMTWSPDLPAKLPASAAQKLFPSRSLADDAKPAEKELKEDDLLQL